MSGHHMRPMRAGQLRAAAADNVGNLALAVKRNLLEAF